MTPENPLSGLSLFVPIYNEAAILSENTDRLYKYLSRLQIPFEILLGSNGSTDATPEIGPKLAAAHRNVKFFHLSQRGPGLAFAEALRGCRYDAFICQDADLSIHLEFIPKAFDLLENHDAVIGAKQTTQRRARLRIGVSDFFILCTNLLLGLSYRDYSIGAKAYRTEAIRPFIGKVDRHTFYTQQMIYQLQRIGGRIIEIPVECDDWRKSRFNLIHEGFYRFYKLFELWLRMQARHE